MRQRRRDVVLPGRRLTVHYDKRRPSRARCALCGGLLHGTRTLRQSKIRKLSKTGKRPERPYGGFLCPNCLKELLKQEARNISWPRS